MKLMENTVAPAGIEQLKATMAMEGILDGEDRGSQRLEEVEEDVGGVNWEGPWVLSSFEASIEGVLHGSESS